MKPLFSVTPHSPDNAKTCIRMSQSPCAGACYQSLKQFVALQQSSVAVFFFELGASTL